MDKELSKKLTDCGIKKSVIEAQLKMPKNSLAGMMNGTRPTPKKWEESLWQFIKYTETAYEKTTFDGVFKMMEEAQNKPTPSKEFYWAEYPDGEHKGPNSGEPVTVTIQLPPKTDDFFKELEIGINHVLEYCRTVGISLQELVRGYMKWREISKIETDNYNEGLKKGWERAEQKYNPFKNPRFTSKMGPEPEKADE